MSSTILDIIQHYQRSIEKSTDKEERLLHCIQKLCKLPVTVDHLQETGVGKTVNSLRKYDGDVGVAAKALVAKWKDMVAAEDVAENQEQNVQNSNNEYRAEQKTSHHHHHQQHSSPNNTNHETTTNGYRESSKNMKRKELEQETQYEGSDRKKEKIEKIDRRKYEESHKKTHRHKDERTHDSYDKYKNRDSKKPFDLNEKNDNEPSYTDSEKMMLPLDCDENGFNSYDMDEEDDEDEEKLIIDDIKEKAEEYDERNAKADSSNDRHHKREQRDNSSSKTSRRDEKSSKRSEKDHKKDSSEKHHSKSDRSDNNEKDRKKDKDECDKYKSTEKNNKKHKSDRDEKNEKLEKEEKNEKERKAKEDKNDRKDKVSKPEKHHKKERHDKHEKSSSKNDDSHHRSSSKNNKDIREKESNKQKREKKDSAESGDEPSPKKHKSSSSRELEEGIDSSMGKSFEEALGLVVPSSSTKSSSKLKSPRINGHRDKGGPSSNYDQPCSSSSSGNSKSGASLFAIPAPPLKSKTPPLLTPAVKLEPLDPSIAMALPTISPNYKPLPLNPTVMECVFNANKPQRRQMTDEEALAAGISSKTIRTKVYSGSRTGVLLQVPSLFDLCIRILQKNIDALEYTGGVPYEVLKPVLERATPQQLLVFEDFNPYLMDDSDTLWELHVARHYKTKKRLENETWREMFLRCRDEQEERLSMLTENIKLSQKKIQLPVRKTQLAYLDTAVKPPRNIQRKQEQFGTKCKVVATPAARVAALSNVSTNIAKVGDSRLKISSGARDTAQAAASQSRPRKAPLMQKTLQLMKGRFKR